jgi:hypothetical protein
MTILKLSEVSKQFNVNRSTIYRAVSSGRLSRRADGCFDLVEVIRCFGEPVAQQKSLKQESVIESNLEQTKIIELLKQELQQYRDREERLLNQIDRMQTLIEMKSPVVADAMSQQQMKATQSDNANETLETIADTDTGTTETLQATVQKQPIAPERNTADAIVQQPQKKRGLLGRLVQAVFDDE